MGTSRGRYLEGWVPRRVGTPRRGGRQRRDQVKGGLGQAEVVGLHAAQVVGEAGQGQVQALHHETAAGHPLSGCGLVGDTAYSRYRSLPPWVRDLQPPTPHRDRGGGGGVQ